MALLPDLGKAFILSKAQVLMARDEKTRNDTDEGEPPEKQQYLVIMELIYKPSDEIEDGHSLGVFVRMGRSYCVRCIAGQGSCRHRSERLWYQYHHWTEDRLGIDRPSTLGVCGWAPGGKALVCEVRQPIHAQQAVKHELTISEQKKKMERGVKRDATEGRSCDYQLHYSDKKRKPSSSDQFSWARTSTFWGLLRGQAEEGEEN